MSYSLNEVQATALKAARAVGYPWGIAEEAAKSTRWLCHHNVDGSKLLARYLEKVECDKSDQGGPVLHSPVIYGDLWSGTDGHLCPLLSGVALSDRAAMLSRNGITLKQVAEPALLLFFAASVARYVVAMNKVAEHRCSKTVCVAWQGCHVCTDGFHMAVDETLGEHAEEVSVEFAGSIERPQVLRDRATPSITAWQTLNRYAQRTYAPATEESRLKGAGADFSDND